jgi:hypothetical protein
MMGTTAEILVYRFAYLVFVVDKQRDTTIEPVYARMK